MILDKIESAKLYRRVHPGIDKALTYIKNTNFNGLSMGKDEIEGDAFFVILKESQTTQIDEHLLESHLKYIDVQYVVEELRKGVSLHIPVKSQKKRMMLMMIMCCLKNRMTSSQ